jgi:nucleoside-diphosphate kinase
VPEKTCFMIKPDGVSRNLTAEILGRVSRAGLKVVQQQQLTLDRKLAAELYQPHLCKPFYDGLIQFITSGPVVVCCLEGREAINRLRELMGATDPRQALPGTIRGDLREANVLTPLGTIKNLVHGSDSPASAERELAIFFK